MLAGFAGPGLLCHVCLLGLLVGVCLLRFVSYVGSFLLGWFLWFRFSGLGLLGQVYLVGFTGYSRVCMVTGLHGFSQVF